MRRKILRRRWVILTAVVGVVAGRSAGAASLNWDPTHTNSTNGSGTGSWDTTTPNNWFNGTSDVAWPNSGSDIAIFGGTPTVPVVTIATGGVSAGGLTFNTAANTAANAYVINATDSTSVLTLGRPATINFTGVGNGNVATINAPIGGIAGLTLGGDGTDFGTLTLTGTNTYSGGTTVSAGTLLATKTAALPGYNVAGGAAVTNATLAVSAGGAGQWGSSDIDTLRADATWNTGANLGINVDATNTFTYGSNITTPIGLTKFGAVLWFSPEPTVTRVQLHSPAARCS